MKIEMHARLTIGNTTTLKSLVNLISDLSFVAGYAATLCHRKKYVKMKILKNKSL